MSKLGSAGGDQRGGLLVLAQADDKLGVEGGGQSLERGKARRHSAALQARDRRLGGAHALAQVAARIGQQVDVEGDRTEVLLASAPRASAPPSGSSSTVPQVIAPMLCPAGGQASDTDRVEAAENLGIEPTVEPRDRADGTSG